MQLTNQSIVSSVVIVVVGLYALFITAVMAKQTEEQKMNAILTLGAVIIAILIVMIAIDHKKRKTQH